MQRFTTITGAAIHLPQANIDTDVIIRIERLTAGGELGRYAFEALRFRADGSENPDCTLNDARLRNAPILLAGANFGCGSSREGAVTALMEMGIRVVIAPSFGDIFHGNALRNGLLAIVMRVADIARLLAPCGETGFTVDLDRQLITPSAADALAFAIDPVARQALLQGLDDISQTLLLAGDIAAWQAADRRVRPWVWHVQEPAS